VAEGLAAQLPDVRYGHAVRRIRWGAPGPVAISCANGTALEADAVVVTVSLGVLKAQQEALFEPALPVAKADVISRLRIGTVDKLLVDFSAGSTNAGSSSGGDASGSGGGSEASTTPAVSFALLWSTPWQGFGGGDGSDVAPPTPALAAGEADVPSWARGVFSIRFGGPEVKQPGAAAAAAAQADPQQLGEQQASGAGGGEEPEEPEFNPCAEAAQPTASEAVAWVTGAEAAAMEAASDEEVLGALRQLAKLFPALQLPPGATWDDARLYR
jgi:hypothetical protein